MPRSQALRKERRTFGVRPPIRDRPDIDAARYHSRAVATETPEAEHPLAHSSIRDLGADGHHVTGKLEAGAERTAPSLLNNGVGSLVEAETAENVSKVEADCPHGYHDLLWVRLRHCGLDELQVPDASERACLPGAPRVYCLRGRGGLHHRRQGTWDYEREGAHHERASSVPWSSKCTEWDGL